MSAVIEVAGAEPAHLQPVFDGEAAIPGYRVRGLLGRGGMAAVYLALQQSVGRLVALKVLSPEYGQVQEISLRFLHEGRMLARLNHRNVITLFDVGLVDGLHYMSMEYVDGGSLLDRLRDGAVPPAAALAWIEAIARGLACAHEQGIVHRDVKPANVLFRRDGTPVLTDFGVAKDLGGELKITIDGSIIGSIAYLSPEQADGLVPTPRTDIYSLGLVLFHLLTGRHPRQVSREDAATIAGNGLRAALAAVHSRVPLLPEPLANLNPLVQRMTAPEPSDRFEGAAAVAEAIERLRDGHAIARTRRLQRAPSSVVRAADSLSELGEESNALFWEIYHDYMVDRLGVQSLPGVATRIRRAVEDPNIGAAALARIVQADAALAAYLVRVASSGLYGLGKSVKGVQSALVVLGLSTARDLAVSFTTRNMLVVKSATLKRRLQDCWMHSCRVAAVSLVLGRIASAVDPEQAMLAGLLHDLGQMVILARADAYPTLAADACQLDDTLARLSARVGAMVLRKWEFPDDFVTTALEARSWRRDSGAEVDLCDIVMVAKLFTLHSERKATGLPAVETMPAYNKLRAGHDPGFSFKVLSESNQQLQELTRALQG